MEVKNGKLIVYKGDQFNQKIKGVDWGLAQIVFALYHVNTESLKAVWVKEPTAEFPEAGEIKPTGIASDVLQFEVPATVTSSIPAGDYYLEVKGAVQAVPAQLISIVKTEFFKLKKSITNGRI